VSQPSPQKVVKQEHQHGHRYHRHDSQYGEGHGSWSLLPGFRFASLCEILLPAYYEHVTYGMPTNIRYPEQEVPSPLFTQRRAR
jgi:hypothetical protein